MLEDAAEAFNKAGNAYKLANLHEDVCLWTFIPNSWMILLTLGGESLPSTGPSHQSVGLSQ